MSDSILFTSESVTEGHPDKLADQISDAVLDAVLAQDPDGRVACEALVTTGLVLVAGEISTSGYVDVAARAREVLRDAGYLHAEYGIGYKTCGVLAAIQEQSPDIAIGVDQGGAGDQGMMFGYATNETPELMPLPIQLAHSLARRLAEVRRTEPALSYLRPDGKSQVTVEYRDGRPARIASVLISAQTEPGVTHTRLLEDIREHVIAPVVPPGMVDGCTDYLVNPTGIFVVGGPQGDTGLTGRKIIVDTYGGMARHGGGCFSGKDPTKVDRSAAYMMRYVARQVVGAGLAERCEIQIAYAIGQQHPLSISVDTFGTGRLSGPEIARLIERHFDLTPAGIIRKLNLRRPIYRPLACYGHFGRTDLGVPWEQDDMVETLRGA